MSNKNPILLIAFLCLLPFGIVLSQPTNTTFSFTLPSTAITSAGVYTEDSTLVRTLWSSVRYIGGIHVEKWDGLLDNHTPAPSNSNYHVKVLSHNVTYIWDGARIGNTSNAITGSTIHRAFSEAKTIVVAGDSLYYGSGYQERFNTQFVVNLNNIGSRSRLIPSDGGTNQVTHASCTDGQYVYWGGFLVQNDNKFIFATRINDNAKVNFVSGTTVQAYNAATYSGISVTTGNTYISGMAVQKNNQYLFVSRNVLNQLQVLNKTTGAIVRNIDIMGANQLAIDAQDKLWLSHGSVVEKYNVNNDGTITSTGITLTGITEPAAIAVSPDNNTVLVADADINQQVIKGFNNSSGGAALWTLGTLGGYITNATVTDGKFFFSKAGGKRFNVSIAFQKDGSFWIVDGGNSRIQHYSSSRVFINRISYLSTFYHVHVDPNNKNRLFSSVGENFIEFALDYTKSIDNGQNGSWIQINNWGANIADNASNQTGFEEAKAVDKVITFSGHTYTILNTYQNNYYLFEMVAGGNLRQTKHQLSGGTSIAKNGDRIENPNGYGTGITSQYRFYALTGLDSDNDPVWAATPYKTITAPVATANDAVSPVVAQQITGNKIIYFQGNKVDGSTGDEYHLSAFDMNNSQWKFKTAIGTYRFYYGDFPAKGEFDNGNGVVNAGRYIMVDSTNIVWTYNGEFWKASQTNYFNHVHTSGLFIGRFGTDKGGSNDWEADLPGNEGNALSGSWVQDTPDRAFVFSGGEGVFAGVHRWRIEGLSTVKTQVCTFNSSLNYTPPPVDLMGTFNHLTTNISGNYGWMVSHSNENSGGNNWYVIAGERTASKFGSQDINADYYQQGGADKIRTVTRSLGTNTGLNTWKLSGKISFDGSHVSNTGGQGGASYFEILDQAGKTITRFNEEQLARGSDVSYVRGNNVDLNTYPSPFDRQIVANRSQQFQISNNNGTLTFQYATYAAVATTLAEAGADVTKPTTIRLRFTPGDYTKVISVAELKFTKDTTNHYRTKANGDWGNLNTWESSSDSVTWNDATEIPNNSANSITIRTNHIVTITAAAAVDQLVIQNGASLKVAPKASLWINDGTGDDIRIAASGSLTIQSDSSGSGRIGNSTGTINGNVVVEKYIPSDNNKAYRLLTPSVNTAGGSKPYIRDNWQEGQNNTTILFNNNTVPHYGTHITGSLLGTNGFDATALATPSLFIYNQTATTPVWQPIANTNATNLEAKKGYLLYVRGDRSIDLQTNLLSSNTTLRATGTVLLGTQTFTGQESNGRLSLVTNPYASSINWNTVATDASTANSANFENYCTYWDPNIGESGGYVNISANGTKSNADNAATEIPAGQAFFIKAKPGITAPTFTVKESHKSATGNTSAFRTDAQAQFTTALYYTTLTGKRIKADAVNAVFDNNLSAGIDGNDAEEIPNDNENIALARGGKMLGIESRPLIGLNDTIYLNTQRLKVQGYEWQFQPIAFARPNLKAYLEDKFLNTRTEINFTDSAITVIPFLVTVVPGSAAADRFKVVFTTNSSLPITLHSLKAFQKGNGIEIDWVTGNEENTERYEVEKSVDALQFTAIGTVFPLASGSTSNAHTLFDPYPKEGNNYYRIKTFHKNGTITYSGIVNVKIGGKNAGFEIYPNPVSGNTITIQLSNVSRGLYNINLINAVGQKVFSKILNHSGGSASQSIVVADNLPLGTYYLQITGNGISYNKKIVK